MRVRPFLSSVARSIVSLFGGGTRAEATSLQKTLATFLGPGAQGTGLLGNGQGYGMKPNAGRQQGGDLRGLGRATGAIGKFYAVKRGRQTGIFRSWPDCQKQTRGFPGCVFKSFKLREEAEAWLQDSRHAPAPRRHSLGPAQVTGSSLGGASPYSTSPPPRHSLSPHASNSFSAMGLLTPGTPQVYQSPLEARAQSASEAAQRQSLGTPESDRTQQSLHAALDWEGGPGLPSLEGGPGPAAAVQDSDDLPLSALRPQRDGGWHFLEFDGASKGNPGRGGAGAVLRDPSGTPILYITEGMARATSNRAEYCALIAGLQEACALGIQRLRVQGDSQLVILQCQGQYAVRHPALQPLAQEAQALLQRFQEVEMRHVPRERNKLADRLSNDAIVLADGVRRKATTYQAGR